jgi:ATP/maltotriose-dependent transcriptional regulator MalT
MVEVLLATKLHRPPLRNMHRLLDWFAALPAAVTRARPKLELANAWLLMEIFADQWPRIAQHLHRVKDVLAQKEQCARAVDEVDAIHLMQAEVDLLHANHARYVGEPALVITYCEQTLARLPAGETYIRSGAIAHLATAYESLDEMTRAADIYRESLHLCRAADNIDGLLFAVARLLNVLIVCGELRQAEQLFAQANTFAHRRTGQWTPRQRQRNLPLASADLSISPAPLLPRSTQCNQRTDQSLILRR